ncbi:MAG: hypothetical protein WAL85_14720 [Candidatus Korobacteraceae bacterium]
MNTKRKAARGSSNNDTTIRQAELILQLYEVRREAVMREARSYVGGEFLPASTDELIAIVSAGGRHSGFVLQVYGYWDMVAAFVRHGALTGELVYDACPEMYFQYAKIQPYLREFRRKMNLPEWMSNIERLVEGSKAGRKRLAVMRKNLAALGDLRAAKASAAPARAKSRA